MGGGSVGCDRGQPPTLPFLRVIFSFFFLYFVFSSLLLFNKTVERFFIEARVDGERERDKGGTRDIQLKESTVGFLGESRLLLACINS